LRHSASSCLLSGVLPGRRMPLCSFPPRKKTGSENIVHAMNWDEVMDKFKKHEIDALGAIVATPRRRTFMRISTPLFNVPGAILVRKNGAGTLTLDNLKGRRVAVVSNYTAHDVMKDRYRDILLDVVPDTTTGLTRVSFGMVDAFVENLATATYYMQEAAISNVSVAGATPFTYQWGIGIRTDWHLLEGIINKGIAAISADERRTVLNRWLPLETRWRPSRGFIVMFLSVTGISLFLAILGWNWSLRRRVKRRTAALDHEIRERQRAEAEVRILNAGLEQRVADRTAALEAEIAERLKAEESLKDSRSRYQMLVDNMPLGIALMDAEHHVIMANETQGRLFRKDPATFMGRYCYAEFEKRDQPCPHCPGIISMRTGRPSEAITNGVRDDGSRFSVKIRTVPLGPPGTPTGFIEVVEDISERQRVEEEKRKLEGQLMHFQKMEAIGTLAGGIAHDFNNILTAIIGYGHLALAKMAKDNPQRPNIEHMLEASARAAHLTQDLLLFSRKQISERKPVDLNVIIRSVEKFLVRVIGEDVECRSTLNSAAMTVLGDAHQLEQVLMNFATNARDAMSTGGTFTITTDRAMINEEFISVNGYGKPGTYVLTTISDTGKGMDAATREHIFDPFFTTKEVGKGTGLGLAVVYGIIKQHEGFVHVYSEPGQGTTFKIYLPLISSGVNEERKPAEERAPGGTETILLAEDDETVRNLTRTVLEEFGYTVIAAVDGQDAVEKYSVNQDRIKLLLFDIIMPRMNGKEAYDKIRMIQPDARILFQSGYASDMVRQKVLLEDKMPVIFKPSSPANLLKQVRHVLDQKPHIERI